MRVLSEFEMASVAGGLEEITQVTVTGHRNGASGTDVWDLLVQGTTTATNLESDSISTDPTASNEAISITAKDGVDISALSEKALEALYAAYYAALANGYNLVVTSTNDGTHSANSLHYEGLAFDLRGNDVSDATMASFAATLQEALGGDYDVVAEFFPDNPSNDHIHVEYDPES